MERRPFLSHVVLSHLRGRARAALNLGEGLFIQKKSLAYDFKRMRFALPCAAPCEGDGVACNVIGSETFRLRPYASIVARLRDAILKQLSTMRPSG